MRKLGQSADAPLQRYNRHHHGGETQRASFILLKLMKRHVLIYGAIGGILITVLQWTEYRFLVIEHSIEIYGGLIAATFAILGI